MSASAPSPSTASSASSIAATGRPAYTRELYPLVQPFNTGFLPVSDIHTLYYEECGNKTGKPIVFLHGGPGGGIAEYNRQFFDPEVYRIVLFEQRGCGRSTPSTCLKNNTTWDLVEDIEKLRKKLGIEKWVVFGGSWGSTLALAYAETHPDRVKALVLRGIFLLRRSELQFFYQEGSSWLFPDQHERLLKAIPSREHSDVIGAFHRRLVGDNEEERLKCATAWSVWEMATSRLHVDPAYIAKAEEDGKFAIEFASIETHYFVNAGFFKEEGQLLHDAHKLKNIPTTIVHGRYDLVCPIKSAFDLKKVMPHAELNVVPDAGHAAKEAGIIHYLVEATDKYRSL